MQNRRCTKKQPSPRNRTSSIKREALWVCREKKEARREAACEELQGERQSTFLSGKKHTDLRCVVQVKPGRMDENAHLLVCHRPSPAVCLYEGPKATRIGSCRPVGALRPSIALRRGPALDRTFGVLAQGRTSLQLRSAASSSNLIGKGSRSWAATSQTHWLRFKVNAVPFAAVAEGLPGCRWEP